MGTPKCDVCGKEMKPLFGTKFFCADDCDRPEVIAKRAAELEATQKAREERWAGVYKIYKGMAPFYDKIDFANIKRAP